MSNIGNKPGKRSGGTIARQERRAAKPEVHLSSTSEPGEIIESGTIKPKPARKKTKKRKAKTVKKTKKRAKKSNAKH